jgi:hypothetical protein
VGRPPLTFGETLRGLLSTCCRRLVVVVSAWPKSGRRPFKRRPSPCWWNKRGWFSPSTVDKLSLVCHPYSSLILVRLLGWPGRHRFCRPALVAHVLADLPSSCGFELIRGSYAEVYLGRRGSDLRTQGPTSRETPVNLLPLEILRNPITLIHTAYAPLGIADRKLESTIAIVHKKEESWTLLLHNLIGHNRCPAFTFITRPASRERSANLLIDQRRTIATFPLV